jgi:hypothetical protein
LIDKRRLKGNSVSNHFPEGPESEKESTKNTQSAHHINHAYHSDTTGALPALSMANLERSGYSGFDFEGMIHSLHDLFDQDRQTASQQDTTRCGLCYFHFQIDELRYLEEGFYVCRNCEPQLGNQRIPMLHKQQKL